MLNLRETLRKPSGPEITLLEECLTLPPVCQQGLLDGLARLQMMEETGSWFKVRTLGELNPILSQVQEDAQELFGKLRPHVETDRDKTWSAAWQAAWYAAHQDATQNAARQAAWDAAWNMAWSAASRAARRAARQAAWGWEAWDGDATQNVAHEVAAVVFREAAAIAAHGATGAVAWEVVKDRPGFGQNPLSSRFSLYELGAVRIDFRQVEETDKGKKPEEMLLVDFPLKLKDGRLVLACLAYPDGRPGDLEVKYVRSLASGYSEITPLDLPRRIIPKPFSSPSFVK